MSFSNDHRPQTAHNTPNNDAPFVDKDYRCRSRLLLTFWFAPPAARNESFMAAVVAPFCSSQKPCVVGRDVMRHAPPPGFFVRESLASLFGRGRVNRFSSGSGILREHSVYRSASEYGAA
jgi:hypothetical protein